MKRVTAVLLLIILCVVVTGCGAEKTEARNSEKTENRSATTETNEPFSLRNGAMWKMNKEQLIAAEEGSMMQNREQKLNAEWDALMFYPAPVEGNYVFRLMYMLQNGELRSIIYDSGNDVGKTEYADMTGYLTEAYGEKAIPEVSEVLKVLDIMLPGMYTEANVNDALLWNYGTDTTIYMFKYKHDMFIIMYVDNTLIA